MYVCMTSVPGRNRLLQSFQLCQPLEGTDSISETPDQGRDCVLHFIDRSRECVSKATDNLRYIIKANHLRSQQLPYYHSSHYRGFVPDQQ